MIEYSILDVPTIIYSNFTLYITNNKNINSQRNPRRNDCQQLEYFNDALLDSAKVVSRKESFPS